MIKIVLASSNTGKRREIQSFLEGLSIQIVNQDDLGVPFVEETGVTFLENALIKARNASAHTQLPALADDSGIVVPALQGAPGVLSARFAGVDASIETKRAKLLDMAKDLHGTDRNAYFYCALVYVRFPDDPSPIIATAQWNGRLLDAPRGAHGFGYDPIFYVPEFDLSAAELTLAQKNELSHRAKALKNFVEQLKTE